MTTSPGVPLRRLQLVLAVTAAAAAVTMLGLFSDAVQIACLVAVLAGAALTAEERHRGGGGWWVLVAAGALLLLAGLPLTEADETLGGVVSIAGAALAIIGATIGFPVA